MQRISTFQQCQIKIQLKLVFYSVVYDTFCDSFNKRIQSKQAGRKSRVLQNGTLLVISDRSIEKQAAWG